MYPIKLQTLVQTGDRHEVMGPPKAWFEINDHKFVYIVLGTAGIKPEGQRHGAYFSTLELTLDALQKQMDKYLADNPGWVFWRRLPEWQTIPSNIDGEAISLYVATARLVTVPII